MEDHEKDKVWPKALSCFLQQKLDSLPPWKILDGDAQYEYFTETTREDGVQKGTVIVFAKRYDNGDFAGLEVADGKILDQVICFHPLSMTGGTERNWNVVNAIYEDIFEFVAQKVISDMKTLAMSDEATT